MRLVLLFLLLLTPAAGAWGTQVGGGAWLPPVGVGGAGLGPATHGSGGDVSRFQELTGKVMEADGRPVAAAMVTFFAPAGGVRSTRSDVTGEFLLRLPSGGEEGGRLTVERLGYRTLERVIGAGQSRVEITMVRAPLPLPGFQVAVEGPTCPPEDGAEARHLWEAMARKHAEGLDSLGVATYTLARTDTLSAGATGSGNGMARLVPGQRGSAPLLRLSWGRRVLRDGYAFPVRRTDHEGSFDSWSYAPLEADFASHFASREFGELAEFEALVDPTGGWVLRFCSGPRDRPGLQGRLELTPDTLLQRAEWQFRTPEPEEGAGGWARFAPTTTYLLPLESMTWRRAREGGTVRRAQWYEDWVLAPGDSIPFLPSREESGEQGTLPPVERRR